MPQDNGQMMKDKRTSQLLKAARDGQETILRTYLSEKSVRDIDTQALQRAYAGNNSQIDNRLRDLKRKTKDSQKVTPQEAPCEKDKARADICEYFMGYICQWEKGVGYTAEYSVSDILYGTALQDSGERLKSQIDEEVNKPETKSDSNSTEKPKERPKEKSKYPLGRVRKPQEPNTEKLPGKGTLKPKRWIHLPANNRCWVEHLVEKLSYLDHEMQEYCTGIKQFINNSFFEHRRKNPDSIFRQPILYTSPQKKHIMSFVIPFIDADNKHLVERQTSPQNMHQMYIRSLSKNYGDSVHIASKLKQAYDYGQKNSSPDQLVLLPSKEPSVLMVKQLWLWTIDERTIITCSPVRLDLSTECTLQGNIVRDFESYYNSSLGDVLEHILNQTIDYIEDPSKAGLHEPYFLTLSDRINKENEEVLQIYQNFELQINDAERKVRRLSSVANEYHILVNARAIHDEIRNLKPIFDEQHSMTKRLAKWLQSQPGNRTGDGNGIDGFVGSDKTEILNQRIQRLDDETQRLIESIQTILQMKQQQASLDMANSTQLQGLAIGAFSIITVVFAPLSFVSALLTIPAEDAVLNWNLSISMVLAEIITLLVTSLMLFLFLWDPIGRGGGSGDGGEEKCLSKLQKKFVGCFKRNRTNKDSAGYFEP